MTNPATASDAIALLIRSALPTVITEGSSDYRVLRRLEHRLSDVGVDFMPLNGRSVVLEVWENIPSPRRKNTLALVDLDQWIYFGIPPRYQGEDIFYTKGYSIENDLFLDYDLCCLLDQSERAYFAAELAVICAEHAFQIGQARAGNQFLLKTHPTQILGSADRTPYLTNDDRNMKTILERNYKQAVRGKTLFQLLVRQLSSQKRKAKFGQDHLYEIAAANTGPIFQQLERDVRSRFTSI